MKHILRQLQRLFVRLDQNLDKSFELFLRDRAFLRSFDVEQIINLDHTDEEISAIIENAYEREELIRKINKLARM